MFKRSKHTDNALIRWEMRTYIATQHNTKLDTYIHAYKQPKVPDIYGTVTEYPTL